MNSNNAASNQANRQVKITIDNRQLRKQKCSPEGINIAYKVSCQEVDVHYFGNQNNEVKFGSLNYVFDIYSRSFK